MNTKIISLFRKSQPYFQNPKMIVKEMKQGTVSSLAGLGIIRNIIDMLSIDKIINKNIQILKMHKPYTEADHILNFVYNFLSGGETILDIERIQNDKGIKNLLGAEYIPDPTTAGDFLARFSEEHISQLINCHREMQKISFSKLPKRKRRFATIECDSSIHQVYGKKKQGADFSYNGTWSYHPLYFTCRELGDLLDVELRTGNTYTSDGAKNHLSEIIELMKPYFNKLNFCGDSGFYDKEIVKECDKNKVDFFITADLTEKIKSKIQEIDENEWILFRRKKRENKSGKTRMKRKNLKKQIACKRNKNMKFKKRSWITEFMYQPVNWEKPYRFIVKRTEIIDKNGQLFLDDGCSGYTYHVKVTNSNLPMDKAMRFGQKRGNQENLIKDLKYGLGLSHIPTGFLNANKAYFLIAMMAWNIKTWSLNLLQLGDGSKMRFKRFLYKFICHVCSVSNTGRNMIYFRVESGEYYKLFLRTLEKIKKIS